MKPSDTLLNSRGLHIFTMKYKSNMRATVCAYMRATLCAYMRATVCAYMRLSLCYFVTGIRSIYKSERNLPARAYFDKSIPSIVVFHSRIAVSFPTYQFIRVMLTVFDRQIIGLT